MGVQNGRGLISRIDKRAALLAAATIAIECATYRFCRCSLCRMWAALRIG